METFEFENDISLICVTAKSFPNGVLAAHEKLHALLKSVEGRTFYGISCPNKEGTIVYKAAVEQQHSGEAEELKCERIVLKRGNYTGTIIRNFHSDVQQVGTTFQTLVADPRIDPKGYCVELYLNENDVQCMVRLNV
ncbi:MAG TPA: transcriptional regulator [Chryseolinea sp.]|nr:transcriptional regulator [Chryseolinea sp.]HPM32903.1 transcriptional regulator [Chryseolinea sp.]